MITELSSDTDAGCLMLFIYCVQRHGFCSILTGSSFTTDNYLNPSPTPVDEGLMYLNIQQSWQIFNVKALSDPLQTA
jgi:hypothetical protein